MKVIVCSSNPTKVDATRKAVTDVLEPDYGRIEVVGIKTSSGVSDMPMSKEECRRGARIRVENALRQAECDIAVGHEGGVVEVHGDWYLFGSTYASDGTRHSWGGESLIYMPTDIVRRLRGGLVELGVVIDEITSDKDSKKKGGAIAYLSKNRIMRRDLFELPTKEALVRWVSDDTYQPK